MRKVCSAPGSLHNLASSKTHEGANQHARMPKSTSTGSFGNAKKSYVRVEQARRTATLFCSTLIGSKTPAVCRGA